jgi:RNA polymerase sigma factor (TIGR02999 family)
MSPAPSSPNDEARQLLDAVYEELRRLAYREMAGEPRGMKLQPTALVHEAFLRMTNDPTRSWADRSHFFSAAAMAMRRILVDEARRRNQLNRGAAFRRVPLENGREGFELAESESPKGEDLLALDAALDQLEKVDSRMAQVVQLRYFAGLKIEEMARVLEVSPRTVRREWETAKLWLFRRIAAESPGQGGGAVDGA